MPDAPPPDPRMLGDLDAIDAVFDGRAVDAEHRPVADLAVLLRAERPTLDPQALRRLDKRFAGSLADSRRPSSVGRRWRARRSRALGSRRAWWPALAAVACVLLAAVVVLAELQRGALLDPASPGSGSAGGAAAMRGQEEAALQADRAAPAAEAGSAVPEAADPVGPAGLGGAPGDPTDARERRLVERSAFLTLSTTPDDLADVASRIVRTTDEAGGYVASSTVGETADDRGGADFQLRIPARELPRTLAALSRLAQVTERSESTRDVTADAGRAARRLAELRAERRGLLRALERAESAGESARIRARLRVVARREAAVRAADRRLRSRAAFATISVSLVADADAGSAVADGRWTPGDAVRTAVRVLEVAVGVALVAAAMAVPLGFVAVGALLVSRLASRRRRSRVLDAS